MYIQLNVRNRSKKNVQINYLDIQEEISNVIHVRRGNPSAYKHL